MPRPLTRREDLSPRAPTPHPSDGNLSLGTPPLVGMRTGDSGTLFPALIAKYYPHGPKRVRGGSEDAERVANPVSAIREFNSSKVMLRQRSSETNWIFFRSAAAWDAWRSCETPASVAIATSWAFALWYSSLDLVIL